MPVASLQQLLITFCCYHIGATDLTLYIMFWATCSCLFQSLEEMMHRTTAHCSQDGATVGLPMIIEKKHSVKEKKNAINFS